MAAVRPWKWLRSRLTIMLLHASISDVLVECFQHNHSRKWNFWLQCAARDMVEVCAQPNVTSLRWVFCWHACNGYLITWSMGKAEHRTTRTLENRLNILVFGGSVRWYSTIDAMSLIRFERWSGTLTRCNRHRMLAFDVHLLSYGSWSLVSPMWFGYCDAWVNE